MNPRILLIFGIVLIASPACNRMKGDGQTVLLTDPSPGIERSASAPGARVRILSPNDGDTLASPVRVQFGIQGMALAPAGTIQEHSGHHHLLIDQALLPNFNAPIPATPTSIHFGKAQTETTVELAPGEHTLQLILGDARHIPHDPPVFSEKIKITVH